MVKFLDLKKINDSFQPALSCSIEEVVKSGWYLLGKEVGEFENEYKSFIGSDYAVGCGNGLDALILILKSYIELGVFRLGDEVIVPANTYIATILAITESGLVPVLVEPNLSNYQIDSEKIEEAITPKTVAVMIVHLYGCCAYTEKIGEICRKHNLKLIEDNAQGHGCKYNGMRTGSLGDAAAHSFYPGKNLGALGDGGMITSDDSELVQKVREMANYGSSRKYVFNSLGKNSRLDEIQAAALQIKLPKLDEDNAKRRNIAARYLKEISNPIIKLPLAFGEMGEGCVYHIFPVMCENRDKLKTHLEEKGIQTLIHYPIPPYEQDCYKGKALLKLPESLEITNYIHRSELSLPISPVMTEDDVEEVIQAVNSFKIN